MQFDFSINIGTVLMIASFIGSLGVIWFRFGRNAEQVFGNLAHLGDQVGKIATAVDGIKELLTRHDVELKNLSKEVGRVEDQVHARIGRLENRG